MPRNSPGMTLTKKATTTSCQPRKLPTIIMCHGWGGLAAHLRADAVVFAKAGYLVVVFDYRGWGASDSRVILAKPAPAGAG